MFHNVITNASPFGALFHRQLELLENDPNLNVPVDQIDGNVPVDNIPKRLIFQYLDEISNNNKFVVRDYFKDLPWINVSQPLSLATDLKGMLVVCDFFTYCCINCLHMLPFLNQFEEKYQSKQVLVLGVHSPKFDNEKSLQNVSNAILRHNITHPICNDVELKLWKYLSINCWPTVVIIGPDSRLLFFLVGEHCIQNRLQYYVDLSLEYFQDKLTGNKANLAISLLRDSATTDLLYPTKVSASPANSRIAIANTLKHSIVVTDSNGIILHIIGSNEVNASGFTDGTLAESLFNYPQGLTWQSEDVFFVCDTENHAIRKVDLQFGTVETVAGNGQMSDDKKGGKIGHKQGLNSPWDATYDSKLKRLYIAMAGSHQIWLLVLSVDGDIVHMENRAYGSCFCFAGDGTEEKRNNRFPLKSGFAQPSGIALGKGKLFIADSESSSIRMSDLPFGSVTTLVGGALDPLDLFAFGDSDGIGIKCKLQHPMGVCANDEDDSIFVADTFNNKIKQVFVNSNECQTLKIFWKIDIQEKLYFNEPNGICFFLYNSKKALLVADTNNHRILSVDLSNGNVHHFKIYNLNQHLAQFSAITTIDSANAPFIEKSEEIVSVPIGQILRVKIHFNFINDLTAEMGASHRIKIAANKESNIQITPTSMAVTTLKDVKFEVCESAGVQSTTTLSICCDLNLCNKKSNYCQFCRVLIEQPIEFVVDDEPSAACNSISLFIKYIAIDI